MAESNAHGTKLARGDGASPEVFTAIANLTSIDLSSSTDMLDVSNHDTANNSREFIPGYHDPGSVSFSGHYDPADATHDETAAGLSGDHQARTAANYQFQTVEGSLLTGSGVISSLSISAPDGDVLAVSGEVKWQSRPTWS